jgi:CRP/FNR family transcriptional regulator
MHKVPLFASLSHDELKTMADHMVCCTYENGERLLTQGDIPQSFTVILEGRAKIYTVTTDGHEKILSILSSNDYFGELHLFGIKQADYSVEALQLVKAWSLSRHHFKELLTAFPKVAVRLVEELGNRVIQLEHVLQSSMNGRTDARIAALLLEFSEKYTIHGPDGPEIMLPLSREGMANYLGIARETMSRKLKQMEASGLIATKGNKRIRIMNADCLQKIVMGNGEE